MRHEIIPDFHNTKKRLDTLFVLPLYTQLFMDIDTGKIGLAVALVIVLPFLLTKRRNIADTAIIGAILAMGKSVAHGRGSRRAAGCCRIPLLARQKLNGADLPVKPKTSHLVVAAMEVVAFVAMLIFLYNYSGEQRLLAEMSQMLYGELSGSAGSGRGIVWKNCITLIREMPIIDSGPGTFTVRHEPYNTTRFFDFLHNDFLQIGVCQGWAWLCIWHPLSLPPSAYSVWCLAARRS